MAEKWLFNATINLIPLFRTVWDINFVSNASSFASIVSDDQKTQTLRYDGTVVYNAAAAQWVDEAYRTVTFATAPSGDLLTWLQANAVKQTVKAVNKVVVDGVTRLDLTGDSVTPQTLLAGATAHNAAGEQIEGAVTVNSRHYEYDNPAAVSGRGNYITAVSGDETLKRVRSLDTLLVVCRMTGTVSCVKSCLGTNALNAYPIYNFTSSCQSVLRYNTDGAITGNSTPYAVDDDTNITVGSGRIYITPEGDLRIYGNTNAYPILAGEVIVEVLW